jgi:ParB family chromosome partitioning protein
MERKLHILKIKDGFIESLRSGNKTFEIRKNDRDYRAQDLIQFRRVESNNAYSDVYEILSVLEHASEFGLMDGFAILSLRRVS